MKNKFQYLLGSEQIAENTLELDFKVSDIAYVLENNVLIKAYVTKIDINFVFDEHHASSPHIEIKTFLNHNDRPYCSDELFKSPNEIPVEDYTQEVPEKKPLKSKRSHVEEPSDDLPF
jgi:hypothetical protein